MQRTLDATREDIINSAKGGAIDMSKTPPHPESLLMRRGVLRMSRERAQELHEKLIELMHEADSWTTGDDDEGNYALEVTFYPSLYTDGDSVSDDES
jgi:hypothetical protein